MNFQKNISFRDANGQTVFVEIEISNGKLSMSGNMSGSGGQIVDQITPANEAQKNLCDIWQRWHLNDMKAGTAKQLQAVKGVNGYAEQCARLQTIDRATGKEITAEEWKDSTGAQTLQAIEDYPRDGFKSVAALSMDFRVSFTPEERQLIESGHGKEVLKAKVLGWSLLYDVHPVTGKLFQYGAVWITEELPGDIVQQIENIISEIGGETFTGSPYEKQANDILAGMGVTFSAVFQRHAKYFPDDKETRDIYTCIFERKEKDQLAITFGQSIANSGKYIIGDRGRHYFNDMKEARKFKGIDTSRAIETNKDFAVPSAYSVLACLVKNDPGTLENFCSEFGYDQDSIKANKIYNEVREQWRDVKGFFTYPEIELLQGIN